MTATRTGHFASRISTGRLASILLALSLFVLPACDNAAEEATTTLRLELEPLFDGQDYDKTFAYPIDERSLTLEQARVYLSAITLIAEDGTEIRLKADAPVTLPAKDLSNADVTYTVEDLIVYARHDLGEKEFELGEVPAGRYIGLKFTVGMTDLLNRVDASQAPAGHPLAAATDGVGNFWSWNSGYIFVRAEGKVDGDKDGSREADWRLHLGTSQRAVEVTFDEAFELKEGEDALHVQMDYAKLLAGNIDWTTDAERICMTMNAPAVADRVVGTMTSAFDFHGVHHGHSH